MLEHLRDFPKDLMDAYLHEYANGILTGCRLLVDENYIVVSPGVIHFDGITYVLKESYRVLYNHTNETAILKVKFIGENSDKDFVNHRTEIFIDHNTIIHQDEIELCRFKLKEGARLRTDYINFEDMTTEYNTVNIIHSPFAAYESSSLSPYVLTCFSKEAFQYKLNNSLDISFCMQCMQNQQITSKELILSYISARLEIEYVEGTNEGIYRHLLQILNRIKHNRQGKSNTDYLQKRILLD